MLFKFSYILLNHLERETQNIIYLWIIWRETKKHIIYWLIIWRETCVFDTLTQTQTYLTVISVSAFFSVSDNFPSVPKPLSLYGGGRPLVAVYKAPEEGQGCHFPEGQSDSQPAASTPLNPPQVPCFLGYSIRSAYTFIETSETFTGLGKTNLCSCQLNVPLALALSTLAL